ncbi:MAG: bifunctional oligoribonuclease/PAP phosphatase NrnA [Candidatus Krumholzibacteriota bacterium]|nr:bifunctional oligoribonuclease/PAP phosphatase NrnA [Candidatus Krumholzibacteriota bacterium]
MAKEPFVSHFEKVIDLVDRHERFLIIGHVDPDGDCIGSMLSLALFLGARGLEAACFAPGDRSDLFSKLPGAQTICSLDEVSKFDHEVIFAVDLPTVERSEGLLKPGSDIPIVNIDHHPSNHRFGTINIVDEYAAATTMLIFRFLSAMAEDEITPDIATCLYLGILMDTGGFRFQNTDAETMRAAGRLIELGADSYTLTHDFIYMRKYTTLKLLAPVLESLELYDGGRIAIMKITNEMLEKTGATFEDSEGFVDYGAAIDDVELVALLREISQDRTRVSLRSRDDHDVASLACRFGGGGHKKAAGLTIDSSISVAEEKILSGLRSLL